MKEKVGEVFSIAEDNPPVPGCTISREIYRGDNSVTYFSLARHTDISAEIHPSGKLLIVADGSLEVYGSLKPGAGERPQKGREQDPDLQQTGMQQKPESGPLQNRQQSGPQQPSFQAKQQAELQSSDSILVPPGALAGMRTDSGTVYTEISIRRNDTMNEAVRAGEVFKLADLVPYEEGRIVNMDVVHNDKMKFVVMAFDAGCSLAEHAAPGEAIIFALDGEGVIRYEGVDHPIKAGENFHFAKGGMHGVKATKRFKMALLLTLE